MSTAPPGLEPTPSETSARNQGDAAAAAWKARKARRSGGRSVSRQMVEELPLGIQRPRKVIKRAWAVSS